MRIVDLTRPLGPKTRVYPGDPPVVAEPYALYERDGFYARRLCMPEHAGTHVDAPLHFSPRGIDAASIPASRLIAPAMAVGPLHGRVGADKLLEAIRACTSSPGHLRGWVLLVKGSPILGSSSAEALLGLGVAGLGVEELSPDEEPYPVHRLLLPRGVLLLEGLDLGSLEPCTRLTLFIGLLRLEGGSGSPARVLGILDGGVLGLSILRESGEKKGPG